MDSVRLKMPCGREVLLDRSDLERVSELKWSLTWNAKHGFTPIPYVQATDYRGGKGKKVYLHRLVMDAKPGQVIDHIDGNTLDNRRRNLRVATRSQNAQNRRAVGRSGYLGVEVHEGGFVARTQHKGVRHYIGLFKTAEDAARAYDKKALELHGDGARLNFRAALIEVMS
jgi:hypothetical protein